MTTYSDSDWACCKGDTEIIKCSRDTIGNHMLKAYTCKKKRIARSSAESGLYGAALGASVSKGIVSLLCDLGHLTKPLLAIDAKATEHNLFET